MMRRPQLMPELIGPWRATEGVGLVDYEVSNNSGTVLKYGKERTNFVQVFGSSENFPFMFSHHAWTRAASSPPPRSTARERVAVLGYGPRKDLFPNRDPSARPCASTASPTCIVGTMAERKHIIGALGDNYVCVPWTTFEKDGLQGGLRGPQHRR